MSEYNDKMRVKQRLHAFSETEASTEFDYDAVDKALAAKDEAPLDAMFLLSLMQWIVEGCPDNNPRREALEVKASKALRAEIKTEIANAIAAAVNESDLSKRKSIEDIAADAAVKCAHKGREAIRSKGRLDASLEKAAEIHVGRRALALSWLIAPEMLGDGKPMSLHEVCLALKIEAAALSPLVQEAVQKFKIKNQYHAHDWRQN